MLLASLKAISIGAKNGYRGNRVNNWGEDIPRDLLYTPAGLDYEKDLGLPGAEPFTRGLHANMYRGRPFTMRQLSGSGSPQYINERLRWLLDSGATGINLILDMATIQMFDSDEPESEGEVGTVGVPIDCVDDMDTIFKDIPLDEVSTSIVTHYPSNTAMLFPMYLVLAERRGIPWEKLTGSVQNDIIMENVVRHGGDFLPPKDVFRIQCDNIEFISKHCPGWNHITLNGYNLREAGTSTVTEMAVAMANGIATLEEMIKRGYDVDMIAPRMSFFWSVGNDFFEEVSRLRAARRLWCKIIKTRFKAKNPRSMWARCHVQTSGISLQHEEPMNNIVRAAYQAMAAILGGTQSLHVDSYDEAYSTPSEEASLLSLRTQQIIEVETQVTQVVDPLGGSYYVEALTNEMEKQINSGIDEIENMGGIVKMVETGWLHRKISDYAVREQKLIDDGEQKIVGRNHYRVDTKAPEIKTHEYSAKLWQQMCEKLKRVRSERDDTKWRYSLDGLRQACERGYNVMEWSTAAVRAGATEGELRRIFTDAFGGWYPPVSI